MAFLRNFFLCFSLFFSIVAEASHPIKVGIILDSHPFSYRENDGSYAGVAVDLFRAIAEDLHWTYEFIPLGLNFDENIDRLARGEFDILLGALSITYERYQKVDFSFPFFLNHIGIIINKPGKDIVFKELAKSLKEKIGYFFPIMVVLFLLEMFLLYIIEGRNRKSRKDEYILKRLGKAFWETLTVFIQGSSVHLDSSVKLTKRIVLLFWLLPSLIFFSIILGSIVSTLTMIDKGKFQSLFLRKEELEDKKLAALEGSVAVSDAKRIGAVPVLASSNEEIIRLVEEEKAFGAIGDYTWLETLVQSSDSSLVVSNLNIRNDQEAFAFRKGSPLLDPFNKRLIYLQSKGFSENICSQHLGTNGALCVL
jgi:polar amino acid transport system substrate-binding protein